MSSTVTEIHQQIEEQASKLNDDITRVIEKIEIDEGVRQGDVYIWAVKDEVIDAEYEVPTMNLQIAKGETKGSRHILEETPSLRIFNKTSPGPLEGPAFRSKEKIHVTHPEHGNFILPAGSYISTYQQDFAREEIAAVRD